MKLLTDINLNEIKFIDDGRSISLSFLDMIEGKYLSTIICKSVYLFNYHNIFEKDDGFACYISEVHCKRIPEKDINQWLRDNNFEMKYIAGSYDVPTNRGLINLRIESGEVVVSLACEDIIKDGQLLTI